MGARNLKPSRVYQTATQLLDVQGAGARPPVWYTTIGSIPPGEILTRTQPIQHTVSNRRSQIKKPSKLFRLQEVVYEEDSLRKDFYSDHPWELARPRVILEQDGKDGQNCDWSKMQQPSRQLDGESVIQRQLWLLHNIPKMTSAKAYDQARQEFYALRHEEDVERRVAKEEALATGAYFGKSMLEIGMQLEDQAYESWKKWATTEIGLKEQLKNAAYSNVEEDASEGLETLDIEADVEAEGESTTPT